MKAHQTNTSFAYDSTYFSLTEESFNLSTKILNSLWRQRQASFVSFKLRVEKDALDQTRIKPFIEAFERFFKLSLNDRRSVIEFPIFRIWFKQVSGILSTLGAQQDEEFNGYLERLNSFNQIIEKCFNRPNKVLQVPNSSIYVARYNVDEYIKEVSPPTYQFPNNSRRKKLENASSYPIEFFCQVLENVLQRIRMCNEFLSQNIERFVWKIIHLDQESFRSCSADRYVGVIFLTDSDSTLIDVEESLIHEYGHQVLYNIMELDPIIIETGKQYSLPWSGSKRDYYGYFHAFYIYNLLASYFMEKSQECLPHEMEFLYERTKHILDGISSAIQDFDRENAFTPAGMQLYNRLKESFNQAQQKFNKIKIVAK